MIFLLIAVFAGIVLFEVPDLIRKKYWRELVVFFLLLSFAFVLSLLQTIGVKIPILYSGIEYLLKDVLHLYYR